MNRRALFARLAGIFSGALAAKFMPEPKIDSCSGVFVPIPELTAMLQKQVIAAVGRSLQT
jgi:hypothetical protein